MGDNTVKLCRVLASVDWGNVRDSGATIGSVTATLLGEGMISFQNNRRQVWGREKLKEQYKEHVGCTPNRSG